MEERTSRRRTLEVHQAEVELAQSSLAIFCTPLPFRLAIGEAAGRRSIVRPTKQTLSNSSEATATFKFWLNALCEGRQSFAAATHYYCWQDEENSRSPLKLRAFVEHVFPYTYLR
jgi:hypothetical protein